MPPVYDYKISRWHGLAEDKKQSRLTRHRERIRANRCRFNDLKEATGCRDCGLTNPVVLDCDHLDPSKKEHLLSHLVKHGYSWERILTEFSKCEVVCANCHRIRTHNRRTE